MKAVFLDYATLGPNLDNSCMRSLMPAVEIYDDTDSSNITERVQGAEIVMANKARFTADLLTQNPSIKIIALVATGTDNVDLDAAREHDVAVCNIRAYCTESVAEHVMGCLLSLSHSLDRYNALVRGGAWQSASNFCLMNYPIRELKGLTLGIVGHGELGKGVASLAKAFGMHVIVAARPGTTTVASDRVSFADLLDRADVISLHCPLNDATSGLFGKQEFRQMKDDAILINTARGGLIDSAALVDALRSGSIGGAAIDVLPTEPPIDGDPLLDYDGGNLMVTPHIAWASNEARQAALEQMVSNVAAFLAGESQNRVC